MGIKQFAAGSNARSFLLLPTPTSKSRILTNKAYENPLVEKLSLILFFNLILSTADQRACFCRADSSTVTIFDFCTVVGLGSTMCRED
jgi:hypothetical protein